VSLFRRRRPVRVIEQRCRKCGRVREVVEDSVTARQRICNLCVSAEVSRAERTQLDLEAIR
jgi:hypothetical protein